MTVAFIDTETTGLDPDLNPVWEIAVIIPDGPHKGEHCWQVLTPPLAVVKNGQPPSDVAYIDQWVIDNTGFGERYDRATAVSPAESAERFALLAEGRHLVGAVPSFDEERLRRMHDRELGRPDRYPWHYHLICVEALAVGYLCAGGDSVALPWDSDDLSAALGIAPPGPGERHTALADARWARAIYERIVS